MARSTDSEPVKRLRIGVLLSGKGTNLQAIVDARAEGLPVDIVHVVASRPDAFGIRRAQNAGIPSTVFNQDKWRDPLEADRRIVEVMQEAGAQMLVMAGYMRKLSPIVLQAFSDRVLNLHPALLPSFPGAHAIEDAWNAGVKVTGVTVHLANEEYDKGPIVAQRAVPVMENDTLESLEERIHQVEHELYPLVLADFAEERVSIDADRKVHIQPRLFSSQ